MLKPYVCILKGIINCGLIVSKQKPFVNLLVIILILFVLSACRVETSNNEHPLSIDKLFWVTGNWKCRAEGGIIFERWTRSSDKLLKGMIYSVSGSDTLVLKRMRIEEIDEYVYYILKFEQSNSERSFQLLGNSPKGLVFENHERDFPNKIIYANTNGDMLLVRFEGLVDGKVNMERSYMYRDLNFSIP